MPEHASTDQKNDVISTIKEYASPLLLGILGMFLWRDISEMRTDIKTLLAQQSADKVEISTMKGDIAMLKSFVLEAKENTKIISYSNSQPAKKEEELEIK